MTSAYPLQWPTGWPRAVHHKAGNFSMAHPATKFAMPVSIGEGTERVLIELKRLKGKDPIISTNLTLRRDGLPYADQKEPADSGVAVYWTRGKARQVMAIDVYTRVADNMAAIAATIAAMRAIERHGGAVVMDRAFTGFKALPAPFSCWDILDMAPTTDTGEIERRFRELAKQHHPDKGGSHAKMAEIASARDEALRRSASL